MGWKSLGSDPSSAWNQSLAQAKVREPEFVPGIPGVPEPNPETTLAPNDRGLWIEPPAMGNSEAISPNVKPTSIWPLPVITYHQIIGGAAVAIARAKELRSTSSYREGPATLKFLI